MPPKGYRKAPSQGEPPQAKSRSGPRATVVRPATLAAALDALRAEFATSLGMVEEVAHMKARLAKLEADFTQLQSRYGIHVTHHATPVTPERGTVR